MDNSDDDSFKSYKHSDNEIDSEEEESEDELPDNHKKWNDDDGDYLKDAVDQINKIEQMDKSKMDKKSAGLEITTEGVSQDTHKNINLAKIKDIVQCHWCGKYYNGEIVLHEKDGNVCKHCFFAVNHDETNRLKFDNECASKGTGIALYIIECKDVHNSEKCIRKSDCYLCDFKLGVSINNILNVSMLGIEENKVVIHQDKNKKLNVPTADYLEKYEHVMFSSSFGNDVKFKIPKKLTI